ncbi:MAG: SIS domain-containing protein [Bacteroidaceae bacterium]|nr:SIS domain-containing protein [Bacteroidaceae bacterium]
MVDSIKDMIAREAKAIMAIPVGQEYEKAVELIVHHVHDLGAKLITSGMGKAGQIAMNMATTFSSTGTPSIFLHPSEAQHGDLGILQKNDIFLLVSNSGKTREILELADLALKLDPTLKFIVLTGNTESPLAKTADIVLGTGNPAEVCPLGLAPTTSTTVMNVIGDALVTETMKRIGFSVEEYNKRHHGGYLGQRSKKLL